MKSARMTCINAIALFVARSRFGWPRRHKQQISDITNSSTLARSAAPQVSLTRRLTTFPS